ncbi:MAG: YczI family protein [Bacillota bacterium]
MKNSSPESNNLLVKTAKWFLGIVAVLLSGTVLITRNIELLPYSHIVLGIFLFVIGIEEYQKGRKSSGIFVIGGSIFIIFVSIFTFKFIYS